jgi:hypothetical protein
MDIDYDELPAAPSPPPPPVAEKVAKAAKQESGVNETHKGRVAAMKGKAGQKPIKPEPTVKAPPKSSKVAPPGKNKTKTQTATATTVPEVRYV